MSNGGITVETVRYIFPTLFRPPPRPYTCSMSTPTTPTPCTCSGTTFTTTLTTTYTGRSCLLASLGSLGLRRGPYGFELSNTPQLIVLSSNNEPLGWRQRRILRRSPMQSTMLRTQSQSCLGMTWVVLFTQAKEPTDNFDSNYDLSRDH